MSLRSPLGRVLGHGVAKSGVHHWWVERMTALALLPLSLWLLIALLSLPLADHAAVVQWIAFGLHPLWLVITIVAMTWHSSLGVEVVLEDYVHAAGLRTLSLIATRFAHFIVAAVAIYAVLHIALRSA
jgi:succinate dehydrogenase / fumarate reductase, membrane anchor subunit